MFTGISFSPFPLPMRVAHFIAESLHLLRVYVCVVLGIRPRAPCKLGKRSTTGVHPQPLSLPLDHRHTVSHGEERDGKHCLYTKEFIDNTPWCCTQCMS